MFKSEELLGKTKYGSKKIEFFGIKFDSKKEGLRFLELKNFEKRGLISELKTQVVYELLPKQEKLRGIKYIADFVYRNDKNETIVEDVKGYKKGCAYNIYTIKKKLMKYIHNIDILEI